MLTARGITDEELMQLSSANPELRFERGGNRREGETESIEVGRSTVAEVDGGCPMTFNPCLSHFANLISEYAQQHLKLDYIDIRAELT
jgi:hypothetical protein